MTKLQQKAERREKIFNVIDLIVMYLLCVIGVLLTKYIPLVREGVNIEEVTITVWQFAISFVVAFTMLTNVELRGSKKGKRTLQAWVRRASAAVGIGALGYALGGG
jgi:hypothetical protein